ncbi:MAG TPA: FtsX-like permease family protein [Desulfomonilaceae bacterium]|nr:FtsX-like permease family protein [Desulfomonilaceae bacterium]
MTLTTLLKFNIRYYRRHRLVSVLCLMGITLGVGIVVAVALINNSALESFAASVDFLSGKATHSIVSAYGRINENLFAEIWKNPHVQAASPVIEAMATTVETGREPLRFVGIDPFLDAGMKRFVPGRNSGGPDTAFVKGGIPAVLVSDKLMQTHHLQKNDLLTVLTAGIGHEVQILGTIPAGPQTGAENLVVMDISSAQEIFGRIGYLDRVDIVDRGAVSELEKNLPSDLRITDANERKSALQAMLYSFQLNLAAMSLLALFVGIFLIYNFSMFSVLSRRENMSLLLTLGAERRELLAAFLTESALLGAAGSVLGIAFGFLVAWWSIDRVSSTISELYFYVHASEIRLTASIVLMGLGVGFVATFVGTSLPALEVAVTPPVLGMKRQSIEDKAHGLKGFLLTGGFTCFAAAMACAWASRFSIFWGFASAFGMTLAFALLTPSFLSPFCHYGGLWFRRAFRSLEAFLAARIIRASLSRTSIAVSALAVALSMTIGVDTMIYSFRNSVKQWLEGSLRGDLYISPATTKWDHPLPQALLDFTAKDPRVEAVERYSTHDIYLQNRPVRLRVVESAVLASRSQFTFIKGEKGAWEALRTGGLFISESLAYHFHLDVGDHMELSTPLGDKRFPVSAITRDYSSDRGTIQMDRTVYEAIWKDFRVQSLALFLNPGASADDVRRSIEEKFPGLERTISSRTTMKEDILTIFDKTFAPTATLKGVSLLVALLGIATALMVILMERSREMTVLGYLGLSPLQLARINVYQALIMGFAAYIVSVVCGLFLTYIIVYAINYRSFGWSIDIHANSWIFIKNFFLTAVACLASSLYPTAKLMLTGAVTRPLGEE